MTITITEEQVSYIKGLDSKKKQRKFLLDCLVEQITTIGESVKISDSPSKLYEIKLVESEKFNCYHPEIEKIIRQIVGENDNCVKITDLPSKEAEEINRLNPHYTTTTAPRTFEIENSDFGVQDELLKFDALEENPIKIEKKIKILSKEYLITEKDENEFTIVKSDEVANEKKYTEEDMFKCFQESRITNATIGFKHIDFAQYLNSLEK